MGQVNDILLHWKSNISDFALLKTDIGYLIYYKPLSSVFLIEDDNQFEETLIADMLNAGVEIIKKIDTEIE